MSLIGTVIVSSALSRVNTIFSVLSVLASAVVINVILSVVPVTKFPVRLAAFKSALDTPVIVYATVVPALTFAVVSVIVTVLPSSTVALFVPSTYVAPAGVVLASPTVQLAVPVIVVLPSTGCVYVNTQM